MKVTGKDTTDSLFLEDKIRQKAPSTHALGNLGFLFSSWSRFSAVCLSQGYVDDPKPNFNMTLPIK